MDPNPKETIKAIFYSMIITVAIMMILYKFSKDHPKPKTELNYKEDRAEIFY